MICPTCEPFSPSRYSPSFYRACWRLKYLDKRAVGCVCGLLLFANFSAQYVGRISDFPDFPMFLLTAGSEDSTVKLWSLPEGGLTECSMGADDALADLTFSYTSIRRVDPSPAPWLLLRHITAYLVHCCLHYRLH